MRRRKRYRRRRRVKRDTEREPKLSQEKARGKLENVVETALRQRTHNDAQTVGTMLAQIPGILEDHGLSFESISNGFRSFQSSIENLGKQMHEDNKQMHDDNKQMHDDNKQMQEKIISGTLQKTLDFEKVGMQVQIFDSAKISCGLLLDRGT